MKKILVTGGNGFIGRNMRELLSARYAVSAPSSSELDMGDEKAIAAYLAKHNFDAVINCAIKPGHRNAPHIERWLYQNLRQFFCLARHSGLCGKIIHMGSGAVYGQSFLRPKMKEDYCGQNVPDDDLGFYKYVCYSHIEKADNIVELRPFGVYGKYEDYSIRFISNALCKALCGLPVTIKQDRFFDYVAVEDLAAVTEYFIDNAPEFKAYNVTPDKSVRLSDIAAEIIKITGACVPVKIAACGNASEYSGDNSRLVLETGLKFTSLSSGISRLADWYKTRKIDKTLLLEDK